MYRVALPDSDPARRLVPVKNVYATSRPGGRQPRLSDGTLFGPSIVCFEKQNHVPKKKPNADTNSNKDYKDLNGLLLRRVTSQVQAASGKGTVHKYDYHLENQRDYRVRVVIECTGANVKVNAGPGGVQKVQKAITRILNL